MGYKLSRKTKLYNFLENEDFKSVGYLEGKSLSISMKWIKKKNFKEMDKLPQRCFTTLNNLWWNTTSSLKF